MTVAELLDRMTSSELTEWIAILLAESRERQIAEMEAKHVRRR